MWLLMAFLSAALLGFYDVFKKKALVDNAVLPVLFLNTLICSLLFLPLILLSWQTDWLDNTILYVSVCDWSCHKYILLKSIIVLLSWLFGYFAMKNLPITIVGPVNATRPVLVLIGAMIVFGEKLNIYQWIGVLIAIVSFVLLNKSSKKEGYDFRHNCWIYFLIIAALFGAVSGLYDKYLMASVLAGGIGLSRMVVQSWYNLYQCVMMGVMLMIMWYPSRRQTGKRFQWRWSIIFISLFLTMADFVYFYSLSLPDAMISVVSMVRRGSVVVSFIFGAMVFHEKNLKNKTIDLILVIISMLFLYFGSIS
ncbi:MAG: EamA family transporter [Prevotella sp.]